MGDTITLGLLITASAGAATGAVQSLGQTIEKLKAQTDKVSASQVTLGAAIKKANAEGGNVGALSQRYERLGATIEKAKAATLGLETAQKKAAGHFAAIGGMWQQAVATAGLGMTLAAPVKQAIDFESAMADVRKVVDGTPEQITALGKSLIEMSRTIPLSAGELAAIAASGGQLGVALKDIPDYTLTVAKMATAFDMAAEETGDAMAKLSNVYQIPINKIGRLGDVINQLSNESPAKASDIVSTLSRIGGVAKQFGLGVEQAGALANAFVSLGKAPEVAGTAINGMLTRLATADKQPKEFQKALHAIGFSAKGLKKAIAEDANGALIKFLGALQKVDASKRTGLLVDLFGLQYADDVAVLAGSVDTFTNSLAAVTRAEGSMEKEFAARAATTANNLQLLKNNVSELGISIGSVLLPALNNVINKLKPVIYSAIEWSKAHPVLVANIGKVVAGLVALSSASMVARMGYHALGYGVWSLIGRLRAVRGAWLAASVMFQSRGLVPPPLPIMRVGAALTGVGTAAGKATGFFGGLLSRFGMIGRAALFVGGALAGLSAPAWLAIAAVGAGLAAAGLLVYKYWKPIKSFFSGLWQGLKAGLAPMAPAVRAAFAPMMPIVRPCIGAVKALGGLMQPLIGWFKDLIKPVEETSGAAQAWGVTVGEAIAKVIKLFTALPLALSSLRNEFWKMGGQLIEGLVLGISGKLGEAKDKIVGVGTSIKGWFSSTLGISSPSKVFRKLGGFLGDGLSLGIQGSIGNVMSAAAQLSKASLPQLGKMALPSLPMPSLPNIGGIARQALSATQLPDIGSIARQALPKLPNLQGLAQNALAAPLRQLPKLPNLQKSMQSAMSNHTNITMNMPAGMGAAAGDIAGQVRGAVDTGFEQFRKQMNKYTKEMGRRAFGGALG